MKIVLSLNDEVIMFKSVKIFNGCSHNRLTAAAKKTDAGCKWLRLQSLRALIQRSNGGSGECRMKHAALKEAMNPSYLMLLISFSSSSP